MAKCFCCGKKLGVSAYYGYDMAQRQEMRDLDESAYHSLFDDNRPHQRKLVTVNYRRHREGYFCSPECVRKYYPNADLGKEFFFSTLIWMGIKGCCKLVWKILKPVAKFVWKFVRAYLQLIWQALKPNAKSSWESLKNKRAAAQARQVAQDANSPQPLDTKPAAAEPTEQAKQDVAPEAPSSVEPADSASQG